MPVWTQYKNKFHKQNKSLKKMMRDSAYRLTDVLIYIEEVQKLGKKIIIGVCT